MAASTEALSNHFKQNAKFEELNYHKGKIHTVGWNEDGRKLASGSTDKSVWTYILDRDRLSRDYCMKGHTDTVDQVVWHPKHPDKLASTSSDKTVRLWDTRGGKCAANIPTKGENINLAWAPDGLTLAVGNKEDLISFIDIRTGRIIRSENFKLEVNEFAWNKTGDLFLLTTGQGSILVYHYPEFEEFKHIYSQCAHSANCICIKFDPSGRYFATGSADALTSLWELEDFIPIRVFSRLDWPVRTISFSYDGELIASSGEDKFIDIASVSTGEQVASVKCDEQTYEISWNPRRHLLAVATDEKDRYDQTKDAGVVRVWGFPGEAARSDKPAKHSQGQPVPLMSLAT